MVNIGLANLLLIQSSVKFQNASLPHFHIHLFINLYFLKQKPCTMGLLKEFREFINKGNVIDLAVAVIIGAAFAAIVSSLVDDVITPLLLKPALDAAGVNDLSKLTWGAVKYGNFLSAVIKFIVIAFIL